MVKIDDFCVAVKQFYGEIEKDDCARYRSWEHCYLLFKKARKEEVDVDYLSLNLAFYLASWGMYRGSSFLLQKDYRIHIEAIKIILNPDYNVLMGINCSELKDNMEILKDLYRKLVNYYQGVRKEVKGDVKSDASSTLITKILMGTLGCVPAYDRFFMDAVKMTGVICATYGENSVKNLIDFYVENEEVLEREREKILVGDEPYPQMKFLDMGFWQIGYKKYMEEKGNV